MTLSRCQKQICSSSKCYFLLLLISIMVTNRNIVVSRGMFDTSRSFAPSLDPPCVFNPLCTCSKPSPDLGKVSCINAPFSVIPMSINSSAIYILVLSKNGLRRIEERSFFGTGISRLEISNNKISELKSGSLIGLERSLRQLNLRNNLLTNVPSQAMDKLQRLKELNLASNLISEIHSSIDFPPNVVMTLKHLDLSKNSLTGLDHSTFQSLSSLSSLDLSSNNIFILNQNPFPSFQSFQNGNENLNNSKIPTISSLEYLNLADNRLDKIPFSTISNLSSSLKILDLSSNIISSTSDIIDFTGRNLVLSQLHLSNNRITILTEDAFENFISIDSLFLSYNPIDTIEDNAFRNLQSISRIHLHGCKLSKVGPYTWTGLERQLKYLDISSNNLGTSSSTFNNVLENTEIFFNDSFNNLEILNGFKMDDSNLVLSPLSLLSSQYSIQELSIKNSGGSSYSSFNPVKYEMHFPSVRKLSLGKYSYGNRLTRSDLLGFGDYNLEEVDLSDSNLDEITPDAFESTPSLKVLNLSKNKIRRIDTNSFKVLGRSLSSLNLNSGLRMKNFPCLILAPLHSLIHLHLENNDIESLSRPEECFNSLIRIQNLVLDFNSIKILSSDLLKPLSNELISLSISFNKLTTIETGTFNELDSLQYLDLSYNHIKKLETMSFANLRNIRKINLEGNEIDTMGIETFYYLPKLEKLILSYNRIKVFSLTHFDQVGTLSTFTLLLDHNLIQQGSVIPSGNNDASESNGVETSIQEVSRSTEEHFDTMPIQVNSIEMLDISYNNLTTINSSLFGSLRNSLTQLRLDNNQIGNISMNVLTGFRHLQSVNLSKNTIEFVHLDSFLEDYSLQVIDLSENHISDLLTDTFRDNVNLRILNLNGNELRAIPENIFTKNPQLDSLHLSRNRLSNLPASAVRGIANLRILDCSYNNIHFIRNEELDSTNFHRLLELNLSHNQIKTLPENIFTNFSSLEILDLSSNPIRVLSDSLFDGSISYSLQSLDLSHGLLKSIPMLNLPNLRKLNLSFNSISAPNSISLTNISNLEMLDLSGNRLNSIPNNLWHHLTKLRSLSVASNPIHFLQEDSFVGLDHLEVLKMENLTKVSNVAPKVLYPLYNLKQLSITLFPFSTNLPNFNVLTLIEDVHSLRSVTFYVQGSEMLPSRNKEQVSTLSASGERREEQKGGVKFPFKLQRINLVGISPTTGMNNRLRKIEESFLHSISSYKLDLSITGTNLTFLPMNLLPSKIRRIKLDLRNNYLSALPDFLLSKNRNLVDLKLSGNPWKCDCTSIGWIRDWLRDVKSKSLFFPSSSSSNFMSTSINYPSASINGINGGSNNNFTVLGEEEEDEEEDMMGEGRIESVLTYLREGECIKSRRSLLEAFRKELRDCRRNGSTSTTTTNFFFFLSSSTISSLFFLSSQNSYFLPLLSILSLTLLQVRIQENIVLQS